MQLKVSASRLVFVGHDAIDDGPVHDARVLLAGREQDRHLVVNLFRLGPETAAGDPALVLYKLAGSAGLACAARSAQCRDVRMQ